MKIVIPTRNRPTSLGGVLDYYARFYPKAEVLIADGSSAEFKALNQMVVEVSPVSVDYQPYDEELSLFDRLLKLLDGLDSEYIVMAADDDYPIMETLEKAKKRLDARPDAVCAGGHLVHLNVTAQDAGNARLDAVRHVTADDPLRRMRTFGSLPFTTTYGVARRELLIERYEFLRSWSMPGFFDLGVGLMDVTRGKFIAVPELGFICTRNYIHSYFRAEEPLVYLRKADKVLELHDLLYKRLEEFDEFDGDAARDALSAVIGRRVAALAGVPPHRTVGFAEKAPYRTPLMDGARQQFADLFTAGTEERAKYGDRLEFIADRLQRTIASKDNSGEAGFYESL